MITIYSLKHNDKVIYVGSTAQTLEQRMFYHKKRAKQNKKHTRHIYNYAEKVGWDNITIDVVCTCDDEARLTTEREVLDKHKATALNMCRPVLTEEEKATRFKDAEKRGGAARIERKRQQRLKSPERFKEYGRRWTEKHPDKVAQKRANWKEHYSQIVSCPCCQRDYSLSVYRKHIKSMSHIVNLIQC